MILIIWIFQPLARKILKSVCPLQYLSIYLFIHHTAYSPQAMAGEAQTNNSEQEEQMKLNKGKTKIPWLGSTAPQSPVTPALVTK
jgi:hypothetical protein